MEDERMLKGSDATTNWDTNSSQGEGDPIKPDGRGGSFPTPGSSGSGHGPKGRKENE